MENKVFYGEYSLQHWIDLILKHNILLPEYQRYFVWNEEKVKTLIETFKKKQFVPPVTIGMVKKDDKNINYILDGQQRLTSILLAYIGLFPDKETFKANIERHVDENDNEIEQDDFDTIIDWNFNKLTEKGNKKEEILSKIIEGNYKPIDIQVTEQFLKKSFLGFSFLVPKTTDLKEQQKFYSSIFRNINVQGEVLLPQESRKSLYFLDENFSQFFDPPFCKDITIKNQYYEAKLDFVRYLSLLSQYNKVGKISQHVARGYKTKMEKYYEEYIYSVVGENTSHMFEIFSVVFPNDNYRLCLDFLATTIKDINLPAQFTSIIDLDMFFFGLVFIIVYEKKELNIVEIDKLKQEIITQAKNFKEEYLHARSPSALKYLHQRIDSSVEIFQRYIKVATDE